MIASSRKAARRFSAGAAARFKASHHMSRIDQKLADINEGAADPAQLAGMALSTLPGRARLKGLALRLSGGSEESPVFDILAIDETGATVCALGQHHEEDVVAVWRRLGASSGLPLMLQDPDGTLLEPYPQIGAVQLGRMSQRPRHGLLRHRRPRFLTRRKTGGFDARPLVHREREIFSGARG